MKWNPKKEMVVRLPIEWEKLEEHLKEIIREWREKQVAEIVNKFLEEIKNNLKEGNNIIFRKHFSLGIMETKERKATNPFIVRQLRNPNLSFQEKTKLEAKKIINISRRKRVRFKVSQNLKREIN